MRNFYKFIWNIGLFVVSLFPFCENIHDFLTRMNHTKQNNVISLTLKFIDYLYIIFYEKNYIIKNDAACFGDTCE